MNGSDTIFALSSGGLPSGVAVIRLSGPGSRFACETLVGEVTPARRAVFRRIAKDGMLLDRGLVIFFPGPHTATGEDVLELHLHGGRAVVRAVSDALRGLSGIRPAEAGEFTRRAFLNGCLDLVEAESLGDLVNAETEAQRKLAIGGAEGVQSRLYAGWRQRLLHARAMLEAEFDFSDEADVPGSVSDEIWGDIAELAGDLRDHLGMAKRAEIVRDGLDVVILGAPNAGKSSLMNALARRDVAIVSDEPGTTRDLIEVSLDLGGHKVRLTDTAGLREGAGRIETMGIARAQQRAHAADVVLWLEDAVHPVPPPEIRDGNLIRIRTKGDLAGAEQGAAELIVSVHEPSSLQRLLDRLQELASGMTAGSGVLLPVQERHLGHLEACLEHLAAVADTALETELRAEELRLASDQLGRITGDIGVEEMLGAIFWRFCIGK